MRLIYWLITFFMGRTVRCLYEDQVGEFDWYEQYVGSIAFASSRPNARFGDQYTFVASIEQGVVAALNDRFVMWKKALEDGDRLDQMTLAEDASSLLVLSNGGRNVRLLRSADGAPLWEAVSASDIPKAGPSCPPKAALLKEGKGAAIRILVLTSDCLLVEYAPRDGTRLASASLTPEGAPSASYGAAALALSSAGPVVYLLGEGAVRVVRLDENGRTEATEVPLEGGRSLATVLGGEGALVATGAGSLQLIQEGKAQAVAVSGSSADSWLDVASAHEPGLDARGRYVIARASDGTLAVLEVAEGPQASALLQGQAVVSSAAPDHSGALSLAAVSRGPEGRLAFQVVRLGGSREPLAAWSLSPGELARDYDLQPHEGAHPAPVAAPRALFLLAGRAGREGAAQTSVLLVNRDDQAICMRLDGASGSLRWWRDEFLAQASHAVFVDLPSKAPASYRARDAQGASLQLRIRLQALRVRAMLGHLDLYGRLEMRRLGEIASGKLLPTRDLYGFRRAMVVASPKAGRLSALHSGDGRVLWSTSVLDPSGGCSIAAAGLWAASHSAEAPDQVYALRTCGPSASLVVLEAFSGTLLQTVDLGFLPERWVPLPHPVRQGAHDQFAFLAVRPGYAAAQVVPPSLAAHALREGPALHFWAVTDAKAKVVQGFAVDAAAPSPSGGLSLSVAWQVKLQAQGRVVAEAQREAGDSVYSALRPLPNRQTALKYTNPNTAAVVVGPRQGVTGDATVFVLDTVTGRVLHSQAQRGAAGPFSAVFGEHWVTVHFYLPQSGRHALLSLDLYEAQEPSVSAAELLASTSVGVRTPVGSGVASSRVPSSPEGKVDVHSRIYFSPHAARVMASTRTNKGIAQRMLLLGTSAGQVYLLDRRHVDARRPVLQPEAMAALQARKKKAAAADGDEHALFPYSEVLGVEGVNYLSHKYRVEGLRALQVEPTGLESTSLLLALGTDHFFTRVQPSKQFDSLREDFAYGGLLVTMALMAGAAFFLRHIAIKGEFNKAWR